MGKCKRLHPCTERPKRRGWKVSWFLISFLFMEARLCLVSLTCGKIKCINKIMFAPIQEKWNFPCKLYFLDTCQPTDITEFRVNSCFRITAPGCEVSGPLVVHPVHPPSTAKLKENSSVFAGFIKQTWNRLGSIRFGSSKKDNLQGKCNSFIRRRISEKVSFPLEQNRNVMFYYFRCSWQPQQLPNEKVFDVS